MKLHHLICAIFLFSLIHIINGIIFYQGRTTACDTCDGVDTNSMRNIMCCFKFSKCCAPETFEEFDAVKERESKSRDNENAKLRNSRRPTRNSTRPRQNSTRSRQNSTRPRQNSTRSKQNSTRSRQNSTRSKQNSTRSKQNSTRQIRY